MNRRYEEEDVSWSLLDEEATQVLYAGLGFSKFEIIESILIDLYDTEFQDVPTYIERRTDLQVRRIVHTAADQRAVLGYITTSITANI